MRALTLGATIAVAATAPAASERIGIGLSITTALTSPADRFMTVKSLISSLTEQEDLDFLLEAVFRPRFVRSQGNPFQEFARLLYPRAEVGPAALRSRPCDRGEPVR